MPQADEYARWRVDGARLVGRWVGGWGCKFRCNNNGGCLPPFPPPSHPTIPQVEVDGGGYGGLGSVAQEGRRRTDAERRLRRRWDADGGGEKQV